MTTTQKPSASLIAALFNGADWDYTYNSERIAGSDMQELLGQLSNATYSEKEIEKQMACIDEIDAAAFDNQSETDDINVYIGWLIADRVAQAKVSHPYSTITFSAIF